METYQWKYIEEAQFKARSRLKTKECGQSLETKKGQIFFFRDPKEIQD